MKKTLLLFFIIYASQAYPQAGCYNYCYTNSKGTCVYSVANKKEYVVLQEVSDPCLSPDGTKIAYTANLKDGSRILKVITLATKKKAILNTHSKNCYGAVWSPDGSMIAYNVFDTKKSIWNVAVIDTGHSEPKILTTKLMSCYSPTWSSDNKSIVVQNLKKVYIFNLQGKILSSYKTTDLTNTLGPSSSDRFILTNNGNKVVFSTEVDEPGFAGGPPTALFIYDFVTHTSLRLTPKGYNAQGIIVNNDKVLFAGSKVKSPVQHIYTVNMDGSNFKLLFAHCSDISAKD